MLIGLLSWDVAKSRPRLRLSLEWKVEVSNDDERGRAFHESIHSSADICLVLAVVVFFFAHFDAPYLATARLNDN